MVVVSGDRCLRAFKATEAFTVEAYRVSATLPRTASASLIEAIRSVTLRSGGALVAATANPVGGVAERRQLERARERLIEVRYYLYLARRLGILDVKRYRGLTLRQDAALRELERLLKPGSQTAKPP